MAIQQVLFPAGTHQGLEPHPQNVNDFEKQAIDAGRAKGYDVVLCGHVHTPQLRTEGGVLYINSGDWIENLTAVEFAHGEWTIHNYNEWQKNQTDVPLSSSDLDDEEAYIQAPQAVFLNQFFEDNKKHPRANTKIKQLSPIKK